MKKALCIVGPTASGKTALAFRIAQKFPSALLSADSRQVYKGLDIISGKDIPPKTPFVYEQNTFARVGRKFLIGYYIIQKTPLYLLDVTPPTFGFTVKDFIHLSLPLIHFLSELEKLPIIVGGTGFYISSLLHGIETLEVPQDEAVRKKLQSYTVSELQSLLRGENREKFDSMNESDRKNRVRLTRAMEVARYGKSSTSHTLKLEGYDVLIIGLTADRDIIKERIDERVLERIEQGAFEEAEKLFEKFDSLSNQVKTANGYKQLFEFFAGTVSREEAIENWRRSEYYNAKKQMTWFKKEENIEWFDISQQDFEEKIEKRIAEWINIL